MERFEGDNETIIGWCSYCKEPVREGQGHVCINGKLYHYDVDPLKNCYFPVKEE